MRNHDAREKAAEKNHDKNYYVLDTESSGFKKHGGNDEAIQIVALLFRNGKESKNESFKSYFLPKGIITESAKKTHHLTKAILGKKGAKVVSPG